MKLGLLVVLALLTPTFVPAQPPSTPPASDSVMAGALRLFIDCTNCDQDYFRTEIGFVDFVRDRHLADVHILISSQTTGGEGTEYTLVFIGQNRFEGMQDTLRWVAPAADAGDAIRKGLLKTIEMGLVRFAAHTPQARELDIKYSHPAANVATHDRWNYWVFSVELSSYFNGEEGYKYFNLYSDTRASRVTEGSRVSLDFWTNYSEQRYPDDLYLSRSLGANGFYVWSLTPHWSAGFEAEWWANTYGNIKGATAAGPALEYNIFPYKESTHRMLRLTYYVNLRYNGYVERTIYDKEHQWLGRHSISVALDVTQPWGSASTSVSWYNYLHDFARNRISLYANTSFNLVAGLSLQMYGGYSRINDQIALAAGDVTQAEELLRLREQATTYSYYGSFGIKYTFGSRFNNVVNRRFGY